MRNTVWKWIDFLYGPFFRVIGFFYRNYKANRAAVSRFLARKQVSAVMKLLAILFLLGWILVWMFASDESRTRLSDEIRQTIGGFDFDPQQRGPVDGGDGAAD